MTSRTVLLILILGSVFTNALAQILLRWGARAGFAFGSGNRFQQILEIVSRPGILGGFACYAFSVVMWIYVLSRSEVSYAYPFLGLGFVLVALTSWFLLGESLTIQRLAGTVLVAVGVLIIARS